MSPKEKAEQLIKKMYLTRSNSASDISMYFAVRCAIICADELIEQDKVWMERSGNVGDGYWIEVHKELEKAYREFIF